MRHSLNLALIIVALLSALVWTLVQASSPSVKAVAAPLPEVVSAGEESVEHSPAESAAEPVDGSPSSTREALGAAAHAGVIAADKGTARIDVLVVDAANSEPLADLGIELCSLEQRPNGARRILPARDSKISDAAGRAELAAPAGEPLHLRIVAGAIHDGASTTIPALAPDERRAVELRVRRATRRVFHGRVLAAEDGRPIEGARVVAWGSDSSHGETAPEVSKLAMTDAEGIFRFEELSTRASALEIHAQGFAPLYLRSGAGHETPERARELRLLRLARLVVHVPDADGERVWVRLTTHGFYAFAARDEVEHGGDDLEWSAAIARDGRCRVEGLLPRAPLTLELRRGHDVVRREPVALTLEPGETREITRSLGGTRITGTALREDHTPIAHATIWLTRRTRAPGVDRRLFASYDDHSIVSKATTTSTGHFELANVAPASYWIGPAPGTADVMGLAIAIDVREGELEQRIDLLLPAGLYIRGRALGPEGEPLRRNEGRVTASAPGIHASASTDPGGDFVLGPLPAGDYEVVADNRLSGARSAPHRVQAGTDELVLQLEGGAVVAGRIVGAAGDDFHSASCRLVAAEGRGWYTSVTREGEFRMGLPEGSYTIFATASGARASVPRALAIRAGDEILDIELRLEPGARVRISSSASESHTCRVLWHGRLLTFGSLAHGHELDALVPPGDLELELRRGEELVATRRVTLAAGDDVEVSLDP